VPARFTLTNVVVALLRSREKTFSRGANSAGMAAPLVITGRSLAELANSTKRPSGLAMGRPESPFAEAGGATAGSLAETSWSGSAATGIVATRRIKTTLNHLRNASVFVFMDCELPARDPTTASIACNRV
jgi:hypothetical protein